MARRPCLTVPVREAVAVFSSVLPCSVVEVVVRSTLMLFVGARGVRTADICRSLNDMADVVVVTSRDILAQRGAAEDDIAVRDVVLAPTRKDVLCHAVEYAERHAVDGALSLSEDSIDLATEFAASQGLPGLRPARMAGFLDKYEQRRVLRAAGVPVPAFHAPVTRELLSDALREVPLPAILKPARGSGGALAYPIGGPEDLATVLDEAFSSVAGVGGAVDPGTEFILESLLVGQRQHPVEGFAPYVSVETIGFRGRLSHLAVTDRFPLSPPALETGMMLPSCLSEEVQTQVTAMAERALTALGFDHGLAHTELMLTADGPRVIEVNARSGGAMPYLFPLASDTDLVTQAGRIALGLPPVESVRFDGHAFFVAPQHPVGVAVKEVRGLDEVAALPGVRAVIPLALGGTRTDGFRDTLIAAVVGQARTPGEAVARWQDVMRCIRPEYETDRLAAHHRRAPGSTAGAGESDADGLVDALPPVMRAR